MSSVSALCGLESCGFSSPGAKFHTGLLLRVAFCQDWVKDCSNIFGRTGAGPPHFRCPHTCAKNILWGQRCLLVKLKKTPQNELVDSMHYCIHKFLMCKHEKISYVLPRVTVIRPFILIVCKFLSEQDPGICSPGPAFSWCVCLIIWVFLVVTGPRHLFTRPCFFVVCMLNYLGFFGCMELRIFPLLGCRYLGCGMRAGCLMASSLAASALPPPKWPILCRVGR